jgi:hypothetical protein
MELTSGSFVCSASVLVVPDIRVCHRTVVTIQAVANRNSVQQLIRLFHLTLSEISTYYSDVKFPENQLKHAYIRKYQEQWVAPLSRFKYVSFGREGEIISPIYIHSVRFIVAKKLSEFRIPCDIPQRPVLLYVRHPRTPIWRGPYASVPRRGFPLGLYPRKEAWLIV